jgi:hypothetical protein
MIPTLLLWYSLLGGFVPQPARAGDAELMPPGGFLQTWKKAANTRVFTSSDLYGFIDGGAEIFLELGFEQLTVQTYVPSPGTAKNDMEDFKVEIYRMTDPIAAMGIYWMNCGKESPDPSFAERHTINRFQLIFKRDRYYVIINNSEGNEKFRPAMVEFARYVASRLPAETPVKLNELLPKKGLAPGSIRLIRGMYGLQSIFTLGTGNVLQLGSKLTAVAGMYQDETGKYSLVLADYPTEQEALKTLANIQSNLDPYLKVQEKSARRLAFKDFNNEFGEITVTGKRITIRLHLAKLPPPGREPMSVKKRPRIPRDI